MGKAIFGLVVGLVLLGGAWLLGYGYGSTMGDITKCIDMNTGEVHQCDSFGYTPVPVDPTADTSATPSQSEGQ